MKGKNKKVKKNSKEDVKNLLLHLESEYRKANISERHYKELKEKYHKMLKDQEGGKKSHEGSVKKLHKHPKVAKVHEKLIKRPEIMKEEVEEVPEEEAEAEENKEEETEEHLKEVEEKVEEEISEEKKEKKGFFKSIFGKKKEEKVVEEAPEQPVKEEKKEKPKKEEEEEITEMTPEVIERLAQKVRAESENKIETGEKAGEKKGFFKSMFGKKEKQEIKEAPVVREVERNEAATETPSVEKYKPSGIDYNVEIEKIKVMIDTVRETGRLTDESVRDLSENLGEIRSMLFQADAELKENTIKMEKIEDELIEIKPEEIAKRNREINESIEKHQSRLEMIEKKSIDSGEKINRVYDMLKSIGGIENLINVNAQIQRKLEDINEAMKYVERIGAKTEKMFIDLNKGLQDLILIKAKQDDFSESLKDIIKNLDSLNVKFEGYVTKKDLDVFKEDNVLLKKQIEDMKKVLPIVELKLPENLIKLRKEREDIKLLLGSLEEQLVVGKISKIEYENIKNANIEKLEKLKVGIEREWKKVEEMLKAPEKVEVASPVEEAPEQPVKEEKKEISEVIPKKEGKVEEKVEMKGGLLSSIFKKKEAAEKLEELAEEGKLTERGKRFEPKIIKIEKKKKVIKKVKVKKIPKKVKVKKLVKEVKIKKEVRYGGEERKKEILEELKNLS